MNTSGSGKTRLSLEHLCSRWGFYFTCEKEISHIGSKDIEQAISNIMNHHSFEPSLADLSCAPPSVVTAEDMDDYRLRQPSLSDVSSSLELREAAHMEKVFHWRKAQNGHFTNFTEALKTNQAIAACELLIPLLARLYVFQRFVRTMGIEGARDVHKRRWLNLQLHPNLLHKGFSTRTGDFGRSSTDLEDIFVEVSQLIRRIFQERGLDPSAEEDILKTLLRGVLAKTQLYLGSDLLENLLYVVTDECQRAAKQLNGAFFSRLLTAKRSILRELAFHWSSMLPNSDSAIVKGCFIFTGTGLSKDLIDEALSSVSVKHINSEEENDTGAFDDSAIQEKYMKEFFPNSVWERPDIQLLRQRISYWLRGRYEQRTFVTYGDGFDLYSADTDIDLLQSSFLL